MKVNWCDKELLQMTSAELFDNMLNNREKSYEIVIDYEDPREGDTYDTYKILPINRDPFGNGCDMWLISGCFNCDDKPVVFKENALNFSAKGLGEILEEVGAVYNAEDPIMVVADSESTSRVVGDAPGDKKRNYKVDRGDGFDEYVLCEMYNLKDAYNDKEHDFDTGDYTTMEWINICVKARDALFADIERRANANNMEYPIKIGNDESGWAMVDFVYEVFENGPEIMEKILTEDWEKRHPVKEHQFIINASAFMTLTVKARNRADARKEAQRLLEETDFVMEHYTEFEIDNEAVLFEDE